MIKDDLGLSKTDRARLEKILLDFDERWNPARLSDAFENLIDGPVEFCRIALCELIKVDLHRHWENGNERKVDSYTSLLESIGVGPEIPVPLILAEYLARHAAGKSPDSKEYRARFPNQFDEFRRLFDEEKSRRSGLEKVQASIITDDGTAAIDTKTENHVDPHSLPETFGRYKILRRLGAGAMGAVYLAHDTQLDRQVALKTPTFGGTRDQELVERFYREARAAANLRHPNICPVFDVGEIDGRHYITMAFIEGRPLSEYVGAKPLDQKGIAGIIRNLAKALADAHAAGVIHRDLKPANIIVDQKRQPLVMDFGLAYRENELNSRMTQSGTIMGTPAYMSPEQVKGKIDEIGPQADIYSLGIILYELLTGRLPFEGSVAAVIGQILTEQPKPPAEIRRDTDPALQAICLKMIAKDLRNRYQSMNEVARDLADFLKGIPPSAVILPIDSVPVEPVFAAAADFAVWADPLALPFIQNPERPPKPVFKTKSVFWRTPVGRYCMIGGALLGLVLVALTITLVFRTPYGTLTISIDDPDLIVEVDGKEINIRDDSPIQFADGSHELALRIGDIRIPLGGSELFEIVGRDGLYRLSANIGETELRSRQFTIIRGENTALRIALSPVVQPELGLAPPIAPAFKPRPSSGKSAAPLTAPFSASEALAARALWAAAEGVEPEFTNEVGMVLVLIPPGQFEMGSPESEKDRTGVESLHTVTISQPFYMGVTEVTQKQWKTVMGTEPWMGQEFEITGDEYPATFVSWEESLEFCQKLGQGDGKAYRLPTEAEWEYACRSGTETAYSFGDDYSRLEDYAWFDTITLWGNEKYAHQVGQKIPNGFGLFDMHGNAWEWCHDWFEGDYISNSNLTDPTGPSNGTSHILRGGSWDGCERYSRSAFRTCNPSARYSYGFRVVSALGQDAAVGLDSTGTPNKLMSKKGKSAVALTAPFSESEASEARALWAAAEGVDPEFTNEVGMVMVLIPPGEFMMGSPESELGLKGKHEDDEQLHRVTLTQPFLLGQTEVTKGQFSAFVRDAEYQSDAEKDGNGGYGYEKNSEGAYEWKQDPKFTWKQPGFTQRDEEPVVNVSWNDACAYCNWLSKKEGVPEYYRIGTGSVSVQGGSGYRLPTEAEWEYACRAGSKSAYHFGDDAEGMERVGNVADASSNAKYNWSDAITADDGHANTSPVGSFRANGFGLFDMHGNVWEWCWDLYGEYGGDSATDPDGASTGSLRVRRGGSWNNGPRRSARRNSGDQTYQDYGLGFRVAASSFGRVE